MATLVGLCLFLPPLLVYGRRLYRRRRAPVLEKRFARITVHELCFGCAHILANSAHFACLAVRVKSGGGTDMPLWVDAPLYASFACTIGYLHCWAWRLWMVFFHLKWGEAIVSDKWKRFPVKLLANSKGIQNIMKKC